MWSFVKRSNDALLCVIDGVVGNTARKAKPIISARRKEKDMEGRILTCVYCGLEYPQGTPATGDQVLTDHIRICPKHPLRAAEEKIKLLRSTLIELVGASDRKELEAMEAFTRSYMAQGNIPKKGGSVTINAIHAIIETEDAPQDTAERAVQPTTGVHAPLHGACIVCGREVSHRVYYCEEHE